MIVAAVLGVLVAASFWLAYFDFFSAGVQRLLTDRRGEQRVALARDAYTYLHLPMVAGIVLFAFAMRTTLAHVHANLHVVPALALCGGSALYLLAYVALRWRVSRHLSRGRTVAAAALAAVRPSPWPSRPLSRSPSSRRSGSRCTGTSSSGGEKRAHAARRQRARRVDLRGCPWQLAKPELRLAVRLTPSRAAPAWTGSMLAAPTHNKHTNVESGFVRANSGW